MAADRSAFAEAVSPPDEQIDLARAALLFAAPEYPNLELDRYLTRLDLLAAAAAERLSPALPPEEVVTRLAEFLHEEQGFQGNRADYGDPRNSFLNEVLDRKLGLPISLSVVWIEVAKRLHLPMVGVGLPGHFIVKWEGEEELLIDPYDGGRLLTVEDCREQLRGSYSSALWRDNFLDRSSNREIIARMLRNLKSSYVVLQDTDRALAAIQMILIVTPTASEEVRDLGLMHLQRQESRRGTEHLERYLRLAPHAHDQEQIRQIIRQVRDRVGQWN